MFVVVVLILNTLLVELRRCAITKCTVLKPILAWMLHHAIELPIGDSADFTKGFSAAPAPVELCKKM